MSLTNAWRDLLTGPGGLCGTCIDGEEAEQNQPKPRNVRMEDNFQGRCPLWRTKLAIQATKEICKSSDHLKDL